MTGFIPDKLPCNISLVNNEIIQTQIQYDRLASVVRVLGTMLTVEGAQSFFKKADINYQLDSLAENMSKLDIHLCNLKAQINFLLEEKKEIKSELIDASKEEY